MRARFIQCIKLFFAQEEGAVLVFLSILVIPLFLMVGLAADSSLGLAKKRKLQMAVDAALVANGYAVGMAVYTYDVSTNEIIIYQDPSIPVGYFELWAG